MVCYVKFILNLDFLGYNHVINYYKKGELKMEFNFKEIIRYFPILLLGLKMTLFISLVSGLCSIIIGFCVAMMRISKNKLLYRVAILYIEFIRGTPLMVQLLFVYFGIGSLVNMSAMAAGILGLSMFSGAYIAEVIRSGIEAIPKGQIQASMSLAMNYFQIMRYIVMPQAIRITLPPICSQFITLIKDSSLVSILAISELTYISRKIVTRNMCPFEIYAATAFIYLFLTTTFSYFIRRLERRLKRYGN